MKFVKSLIAAAVAATAFGASAATFDLGSSDQLGSPNSFSATFNNTIGATSGTLSFTLQGFSTLDGFFGVDHVWTDQFSLSLNGATIGSGYFRLGGGGSTSWTGTGNFSCTTCGIGQTNSGGQATFSNVALNSLTAGINTVTFAYAGNNEGFGNESWKISGAVVTAVPEPETYAMMLAGLGLMGAIARRRKSKAA